MNEPPIASPFGAPNTPEDSTSEQVAPLLKVLVGAHWGIGLFTLLLTTALNKKTFAATPSFYWAALLGSIVVYGVLSSLICLGLLRASKTSWWLTQASFVFGIYSYIHTILTPHDARLHLGYTAPLALRVLIWAVQTALSLYLLTPAMRQFFFARPKTN
jgi:uncharacterized membrane protein